MLAESAYETIEPDFKLYNPKMAFFYIDLFFLQLCLSRLIFSIASLKTSRVLLATGNTSEGGTLLLETNLEFSLDELSHSAAVFRLCFSSF